MPRELVASDPAMEFSNGMQTDNIISFEPIKSLDICAGEVVRTFTGHESEPIQSKSPLLAQLLMSPSFPNEFGIFLNYCRALRFDDKPDRSCPRKLFHDLFVCEGYQYDYVFNLLVVLGLSLVATEGV